MPPYPMTPSKPSSISDSSSTSTHSVLIEQQTICQPPLYYQWVLALLKPLYRLHVWRRSHKRGNYHQEVAQRFGKHYPTRPVVDVNNARTNTITNTNKGIIWCHAVSLGETNTVAPLLDVLLSEGYQIWLTNTTQTGFGRGASRFADDISQGRLSHSYVPVDSPAIITTFLAHVRPVAALFVETELWANILTKLSEQRIPSILVNGRLSASSYKSYQKINAVSTSMMQNLTLIIAQDNESAKRFQKLGANSAKIRIAGSLKWVINTPQTNQNEADQYMDQDINQDINQCIDHSAHNDRLTNNLNVSNRLIWVAASTHADEEDIALTLQQQVIAHSNLAGTLLIIVPRHPERFDAVAKLIQSSGLQMARRSNNEAIQASTQVYLADSMGELMQWYALANVALVGGSLVDVGGHNPVEPASVATPVLMGRYTQSCQSVVDKLSEVGALYQPNNTFYQPINSEAAETDSNANINEQLAIDKQQYSDNEDVALIYEQLVYWLKNPKLAKLAGQAGAHMTAQQQAVLTLQSTMIKDVITQYSKTALS